MFRFFPPLLGLDSIPLKVEILLDSAMHYLTGMLGMLDWIMNQAGLQSFSTDMFSVLLDSFRS